MTVSFRTTLAACLTGVATFAASLPTAAEEPIRIGFLSTFSGPGGQLGQELLDGFALAIADKGGKLGGRTVQLIQGDDQAKPDVGRQVADKMIERDKVQILTGVNFSNVMLAVAKPALDAGAFVVSVNAGPSQYAGTQCHPHFFVGSFQNDTAPEAMGLEATKRGIKKMYLMAPNYPAGKDFLAGFKRFYKGEVVGEVYTAFGQLDYAAEIAQLRAAAPDGVFFFYPGGMGINFVKQYDQAGLKKAIPLYGPSFSLDQTVLPAIGDAAVGAFASTHWAEDADDAASKAFIAAFETKYGRLPSPNAAQSYDTAMAIDAALTTIGGRIEDADAFQKALETVKFTSLRGKFRFNTNHYPVQDFWLAEIVKDAKGRPVMAKRSLIVADHPDAYVDKCKMK